MNSLTHYKLPGEALRLAFIAGHAGLAKGTLKGIFNAWVAASVIDQRGAVWVKASELHTILRTSKDKVRYLVGSANRRDKVQMTGESLVGGEKILETLVRSSKVCEWVNESIQSPAGIRTTDYLKYSEMVFRQVRDSVDARMLRAEFREQMESTRRHLKKQRVKRLKLKHDELTGVLLKRNANFAHIRAVCAFFEMSDKDWNGVVVNVETHALLTNAGVFDENELLHICRKNEWKTDWHDVFKRELRVFEGVGEAA